jgi:uncharacterized RDD family membrane protein YckC
VEKYGTAGRRILATFIDTIVFIPIIIVDYNLTESSNPWIIIVWLILSDIIYFSYSILMHAKYGQTIGKMLSGITVMNLKEERHVNLKESVLRDSVWIFVSLTGFFYFLIMALLNPDRTTENFLLYDDYNGIVAGIWLIIELVSMMTNKKRRAVHDYIAGSVVVITSDYIGQYKPEQSSSNPE